jgi:WD40-like Beta Propeller Repeat
VSSRLVVSLVVALAVAAVLTAGGSFAGARGLVLAHGGAVVFASDYGIFVANVDGTALTRLTVGGNDDDPAWSAEAKRVAFSGLDGVVVMNADGSSPRRVGTGSRPAWSPDGTRIAFEARGITVVSPDGTGARQVAARSDFGFAWSPDGKRIAYGDEDDPARIQMVDVASGASTTLGSASFERAFDLAWSPDGTKIAFDGDGLELIEVATGQVTKLTDKLDAFMPAWSPDSTRIAFIRDGGLFTIGRDGRGERRLATVGDLLGDGSAASWSRDGKVLVYEKERYGGSFDLDVWRVRADGTGAKPITHAFPTGSGYHAPDWAATTIPSHPAKPLAMVSLRPTHVATTPRAALSLAADGDRAAIATDAEFDCGPVFVWRPGRPAAGIAGSRGCGDAGARSEFAFASGIAAWTYEEDTITIHGTYLLAGRPGSPARDLVDADHDRDDYLGNLSGDGPLLVYDTWKETWPSGYERPGLVKQPKLWRIVGDGRARSRLVLAGPDALDVVSVDAGRIAVLRRDGTCAVLSDRGRRLSAFVLGRKGVEGVRLSGSELVVLRGTTFEVRDATRGTVKHRWAAVSSIAPIVLKDVQGPFAVYTAGIAIHLLRLADGRDRTLAIANQAGPADADLEPEGLYYSYNETGSATPGRVAFVPLAQLTKSFH